MVANMKIDDVSLTGYLVKHLQPLTEADPTLLANYVVALLKNNKPKKDLQKLCIDQLFDFLGEETKPFVQRLFHALEEGTTSISPEEPDSKWVDAAVTMAMSTAMTAAAAAAATESATTVTHTGEKADLKAVVQSEKATSTNNGLFSDQEEGTDDEDDDRNHKHRRRVSRSNSFDKDIQDEDARGPYRKRSRPAENGQPFRDDRSFSEPRRGSIMADGLLKSERRKNRDASLRVTGDGTQRVSFRGGPTTFRNEGTISRLESQNGLSRGILGRGRGGIGPWGSHESRIAAFDSSDYNPALVQPSSSTTLFSGRSMPNRGNPSHLPWGGYGHHSGLANGALDQSLPLKAGIQGSRGVQISTAMGVGVNIGIGMTLGRPRCPDFEERGYCLRGDLCPMEHGANRIVVEDVQSLSQFNLPVALPSGRAVAGSSAPVSGPSPVLYPAGVGLANRPVREASVSRLDDTDAGGEPDLYDPDEPLWTKEQSDAGAGLRRLTSLRKGHDDHFWEGNAPDLHPVRTPDASSSDKYGRLTLMGGSSQSQVAGHSVWDRIGPVGRNEAKSEVSNRPSNSYDGPPRPKMIKKEAVEDTEAHGKPSNWEGETDKQEQIVSPVSNSTAGKGHGVDQLTDNAGHMYDRSTAHVGGRKERAQRTLYVRCIPSDNNKKELLLAHFQKFGDVMDIRIPMHSDRAFVQFYRREDAESALLSPDAVMGNRFIRLSWANRDSIQSSSNEGYKVVVKGITDRPNEVATSQSPLPLDKVKSGAGPSTSEPLPPDTTKCSGLNGQPHPSAVAAQKKKEELEHMKEELRQKQQELARKRNEFRLKLEHLSKQGNSGKGESETDPSKNRPPTKSEDVHGPTTCANQQLTIDKNVITSEQTAGGLSRHSPGLSGSPIQPPVRSPYPRSGLISTGSLGPPQSSVSRFKLDNRTTVFRILPPLPEGISDVKILKEHFLNFGELSSLEVEDKDQKSEGSLARNSSIRLTFNSRRAAENAFIQGRWFQGTSFQVAWVNPATPPATNKQGDLSRDESTSNSRGSHSSAFDREGSEAGRHMLRDRSGADDISATEVQGKVVNLNEVINPEDSQLPVVATSNLPVGTELDDAGETPTVVSIGSPI